MWEIRFLLCSHSSSYTIRFLYCLVIYKLCYYHIIAMLGRCTEPGVHISVTKMSQEHENGYKSLCAKCDLIFCVFTAVQMEH